MIKLTLIAAALAGWSLAAGAAGDRIVTGSERGTYIEIGRDLSRLVAQPAGLSLDVQSSKGSTENVRRLRSEPGVRLALVQSDVYRAYWDQALAGDAEAAHLVKPLRVVMPLYDEEIYFVVSGKLQFKLGADVIEATRGTAIRVAPEVVRSVWNDEPEDAELVIVAKRIADPESDFSRVPDFWPG